MVHCKSSYLKAVKYNMADCLCCNHYLRRLRMNIQKDSMGLQLTLNFTEHVNMLCKFIEEFINV